MLLQCGITAARPPGQVACNAVLQMRHVLHAPQRPQPIPSWVAVSCSHWLLTGCPFFRARPPLACACAVGRAEAGALVGSGWEQLVCAEGVGWVAGGSARLCVEGWGQSEGGGGGGDTGACLMRTHGVGQHDVLGVRGGMG